MQEYTSPPIIPEAAELLRRPLTTIGEELEMQIIALDGIRYSVAIQICETLKLLAEKKKQLLWPKEVPNMKQTELDRQTKLNADVAPIEADYQLLIRIEALIDSKINLCLAFL